MLRMLENSNTPADNSNTNGTVIATSTKAAPLSSPWNRRMIWPSLVMSALPVQLGFVAECFVDQGVVGKPAVNVDDLQTDGFLTG